MKVRQILYIISLLSFIITENVIITFALALLLLLLSYHRRLRMILRSARAARGKRSG